VSGVRCVWLASGGSVRCERAAPSASCARRRSAARGRRGWGWGRVARRGWASVQERDGQAASWWGGQRRFYARSAAVRARLSKACGKVPRLPAHCCNMWALRPAQMCILLVTTRRSARSALSTAAHT